MKKKTTRTMHMLHQIIIIQIFTLDEWCTVVHTRAGVADNVMSPDGCYNVVYPLQWLVTLPHQILGLLYMKYTHKKDL